MKETLEQQTGYGNEPLQQIVGSETALAARSREQSSVEHKFFPIKNFLKERRPRQPRQQQQKQRVGSVTAETPLPLAEAAATAAETSTVAAAASKPRLLNKDAPVEASPVHSLTEIMSFLRDVHQNALRDPNLSQEFLIRAAIFSFQSLTCVKEESVRSQLHTELMKKKNVMKALWTATRHPTLSADVQLAAAEIMASLCDTYQIRDEFKKAEYCGFLAQFLPNLSNEKKSLVLDHFIKICNPDVTRQPNSFVSFYETYSALIENVTQGTTLHFLLTMVGPQQKENRDDTTPLKVIKFLWVLSQDTDHSRNVRRKLRNDKAVKALVEGLKYWNGLQSNKHESHLFYILDALANLLEPLPEDSEINRGNHLPPQQVQQELNSVDDAYSDFINSDGLSEILEIVITSMNDSGMSPLKSACRLLLLLSPHMLKQEMVEENALDPRMVTAWQEVWQEVRNGLNKVNNHLTSKNIMSMKKTCELIKSLIGREADLQAQQDTSIAESVKMTFLIAAPQFDSYIPGPMDKLDFDTEKEHVLEALKTAPSHVEFRFDNATRRRLLMAIFGRSQCIHFSGHGDEQYLAFEHGENALGVVDRVYDKELHDFFKDTTTCKLVFLSACSSENAGKVLTKAKIPHVVCIKTGCNVKDVAAREFAKLFYASLFRGDSVNTAFVWGCKGVRTLSNLSNPVEESEKFLLLPLNGSHDEIIFQAPQKKPLPIHTEVERLSPSLETRNLLQEDPSPKPPKNFFGRETDICYLFNVVLKSQVICVVGKKDQNDEEARGETGIGRYSLVCALCHYINERSNIVSHKINKIFLVEVRKYWKVDKFGKLVKQLLKLFEIPELDAWNDITDIGEMIKHEMMKKKMTPDKAMFVFCRIETLSQDELTSFEQLVGELKRTGAKILYTDEIERHFDGVESTSFTVVPLDFRGTVLLFAQYSRLSRNHKTRFKNFVEYAAYFSKEEKKEIVEKMGKGIPLLVQQMARLCKTLDDLKIPWITFRGTVLLFAQYSRLSRDHEKLLRDFVMYADYFSEEEKNEFVEKMGMGIPLLVKEKAHSCKTFDDLEIPWMTTARLRKRLLELETRIKEAEKTKRRKLEIRC